MEQRIPPQNVEAEQAVLGAMLLSHDAVIVAMEKLQSQDFYRDVHRIIFEAMEHLHRENKEIDVITLPDELKRMKKLDDVGGLEYVLNLPNLVGSEIGSAKITGSCAWRPSSVVTKNLEFSNFSRFGERCS